MFFFIIEAVLRGKIEILKNLSFCICVQIWIKLTQISAIVQGKFPFDKSWSLVRLHNAIWTTWNGEKINILNVYNLRTENRRELKFVSQELR